MDSLGRFGVNDGNRHPSKESERYEALFSVGESVVLERECRTFKHPRRINEVEAMSLQVRPAFPFIPREAHRRSVYTGSPLVKTVLPRSNRAAVPRAQRFAGASRNQRLLTAILLSESSTVARWALPRMLDASMSRQLDDLPAAPTERGRSEYAEARTYWPGG